MDIDDQKTRDMVFRLMHLQEDKLKKYISDKGVDVVNCECITKFDAARSHSYKIVIKASDYEKCKAPSMWPARVGLRLFKKFWQ